MHCLDMTFRVFPRGFVGCLASQDPELWDGTWRENLDPASRRGKQMANVPGIESIHEQVLDHDSFRLLWNSISL